ncbi:MAG: stalk domain-containing protein [Clostridia bacterium]|nr:stalk domain-containing protein [Clostridia bacterium]
MKHNQTLRRGLGILIALIMCLSLLTVTALAEGTQMANFITDPITAVDMLGGRDKASWENNTLTLNGVNFTTTNEIAVLLPGGATIVLEGENTIASEDTADRDVSYGIRAEGNLTITGNGTLTVIGGEADLSYGIYANNGDITISDGTVIATGSTAGNVSRGIYTNNGSVTIYGGTVTAEGGNAERNSFGICANNGDITISDGTVIATSGEAEGYFSSTSNGIFAVEGMNISGGTVTATGSTARFGSYGICVRNNVAITGGTVNATGDTANWYSVGIGAEDVTISGGNVTAIGGEVMYEETRENDKTEEYEKFEKEFPDVIGKPTESYGIESHIGNIIISGGNVIAKTVAKNKKATRIAMNVAPDLSGYASYWWRTDDDSFTSSDTKAYTYSEKHTYAEIASEGSDDRGYGSRYSLEQITSKYAVNVNISGDGTAEADKNTAGRGATVTITVTPDEGCELVRLVVTDKYGDVIDVVDQGNGEYTFRMPSTKVNIDAYFTTAKPEAAEKTMILTIGETAAEVNGEYVENDVAPVIRNERTMLPVRFVAEALGAEVAWDEAAQKVTITKGETVIEIYINQPFAFVNNEAIELDSPAFIENSRTYLPLRFIVENLGAEVEWDAVSQKVIIKY